MITHAINKLVLKENLDTGIAKEVMNEIMEGRATNAQIGAFLTAMRLKGETIDEITACAKVMREKCISISPRFDVMDIVGTGGDELYTFNISTITAIIVASGGVPVAKHGNRSVSSKCGSADLLEALGVKIALSGEQSLEILEKIGICFMFAPSHHSSMKYAAPVRKELGIRTIFNILGPLSNPAGATMQLLGVYDENLVEPLARVLLNLGVKRAMVVHGHDGLDEVSLTGTTTICDVSDGKVNSFFIDPSQFGFEKCKLSDIRGGDPKENAKIALDILSGRTGPMRDIVVLNSAICLYMASKDKTLKDCVKHAQELIDSGKAKKLLDNFIEISQRSE